MKVKCYNKSSNEVNFFDFDTNLESKNFKREKNIPKLDEGIKDILNLLPEYGSHVFSPNENIDDFLLEYSSPQLLGFFNQDLTGFYTKDIYINDENNTIFKILKDVYDNDNTNFINLEFYHGNVIVKAFDFKIVKNNNNVIAFSKNIIEEVINQENIDKIFYNDAAKLLVRDNKIIKSNKAFSETFNIDSSVISEKNLFDIINFEDGLNSEEFNSIYLKLQSHESLFEDKIVNCTINNKKYLLKLHFTYTISNDDFALMIFFDNINDSEEYNLDIFNKYNESLKVKENFNRIQKVSQTAMSYVDDGGEIVWSPETFNIFEVSPEEYRENKNVLNDCIVEEDRQLLTEAIKQTNPDNPQVDFVQRIITGKGNLKYIKTYVIFDYDEEGNVEGHVSFHQDITEQENYLKNFKEKSREACDLQRNLNRIQNVSRTAVSYGNEDGSITWSPEMFKILELDSDIYNQDYHGGLDDFMVEEDKELLIDAVKNCSKDNPEASFTQRVKTPKGNIKYIKTFITFDYNEEGKVTGHVSFHQDVTDEMVNLENFSKKSKEAIKLQDNLNRIQSVSKTAISYSNDEGDKTWSPEIFKMLELDSEEFEDYRYSLNDFIIDEDKHLWHDAVKTASKDKPEITVTQRAMTLNGNIKYIKTYGLLDFDGDGNLIGHIAYHQDVTEEENYLREFKAKSEEACELQKNLSIIKKVSKTAISFSTGGRKVKWSKEMFGLLELDIDEFDEDFDGSLDDYVVEEDKQVLFDALRNCGPDNPETSFVQRVITAKGNEKYIKTFIKFEYDGEGNRIRHISFHQDITEEVNNFDKFRAKSEEALRLQRNLERIQTVSKTAISYSHIGEPLNWSKELFEIFELDPDDYETYNGDLSEFIIEEDKSLLTDLFKEINPKNPSGEMVQRVRTANGKLKYIKTNVLVNFGANGKPIRHVSFHQDVTDQETYMRNYKKISEEAFKLSENLKIIQEVSKTAMSYTSDDETVWTPEIYDILEVNPNEVSDSNDLMYDYTVPDDKFLVEKSVAQLTPKNPTCEFVRRIITGRREIKSIKTFIKYEYDGDGNLINRISFYQDISDEIRYQNRLKDALADREVLLREVHDKVKNNLQVILSLIDLEKRFKIDNPKDIIDDIHLRIVTMAVVHEKIHSSNLISRLNLSSYMGTIADSCLGYFNADHIQVHADYNEVEIGLEKTLPLGLIVNELTNNTIRHGFREGDEGNIYITILREEHNIIILFEDDGMGLPEDFDLDNLSSLGLMIVKNLTAQIEGEISVLECNGAGFKIEFEDIIE